MNLATLQKTVPSIFTAGGSHATSDKYQPIPTIKIVEQLDKLGFKITKAMQTNSRDKDNRPFAKHMLRFRHESSQPTVGSGLFPEIVLVNSHDGKSSYKLMSGLYRLVCSNGLVRGDTTDEVTVRHQGDILGNVIEGSFRVIDTAQKMIAQADEMSEVQLDYDEKMLLAKAALGWNSDVPVEDARAERYLRARNMHDHRNSDLFTTFNVIQENIIKGGVRIKKLDANGRLKDSTTREVKSIDSNIKLNRALWTLAEKFHELKTQ